MRSLLLAAILIAVLDSAAAAGKFSPKAPPGGGYQPPLQMPQPQIQGPLTGTDLGKPLQLEDDQLLRGLGEQPTIVVPPNASGDEPAPDGGGDCQCRCADSTCSDGQGGLCPTGDVDLEGFPVRQACQ